MKTDHLRTALDELEEIMLALGVPKSKLLKLAPMRIECVGGVTQDLARDDDVPDPKEVARDIERILYETGVSWTP